MGSHDRYGTDRLRAALPVGRGVWQRSIPLVLLALLACSDVRLDPKPSFVRARFDPEARVIPLPNDLLRDAQSGQLDLALPLADPSLTPAERELYGFFATLDGWPSSTVATLEFSGPLHAGSLNAESLQIWKWGSPPARVDGLRITLASDAKQVTIEPPVLGWERGARYFVLVRGGAVGVEDSGGGPVECDAAFYFLRQRQRLDTDEHQAIFPGATTAERKLNAERLEALRRDLAPAFDFFEQRGVPRKEVALLWSFTIGAHTELAIDAASERVPLPSQLLIDPRSGRIDVPDSPSDTPFQRAAKQGLRGYDGFSISGTLLFEFSGPMDPASVNPQTVRLHRIEGGRPTPVAADVRLMDDGIHVVVSPQQALAAERVVYAVTVGSGVRDVSGRQAVPMPAAFLLMARAPLVQDGRSAIPRIDLQDALRLEAARTMLAPALDALGRDGLVGAWPFVTMSVQQPLRDAASAAERLSVPPDPAQVRKSDWWNALLEFPLSIASFGEVGDVYYGTLKSPQFLDPVTRAWRVEGGPLLEDLRFIVTAPASLPQGPLGVVIFAHAIGAERRFLLAIGDALAARGLIGIAIDLPYHGARSVCTRGARSLSIDPLTGKLVSLDACDAGDQCDPLGRCVSPTGELRPLASWPVLEMPVASGDAFFEFDDIALTRDHVRQAIVDLGALERSLRKGNWQAVLGRPIDPTRIHFAGASLGGIVGATWLGASEVAPRAVLNVPGADLVDVIRGSALLSGELEAFLASEGLLKGSFEEERALNVARWFVDSVDPQSVAAETAKRKLLVQMATGDTIIPNWSTQLLSTGTGAQLRNYSADHLFLVVPLEDEFTRGGSDLAEFLAGGVP